MPQEKDLEKYLSTREKKKSFSFSGQDLRRRYVISHAILRFLLAKYLKIEPHEIEYFYGEYQKPFCANSLSPFFNMSHSKNMIVYIFNIENDVGIDIEFIDPYLNYKELIDIVFSEEEKNLFYQISFDLRRSFFYRIWTLKEAFLKAKGVGLHYPLSELTTIVGPKTFSIVKSSNKIADVDNNWSFFPLSVPLYSGAFAVQNKNTQPIYYDFSLL